MARRTKEIPYISLENLAIQKKLENPLFSFVIGAASDYDGKCYSPCVWSERYCKIIDLTAGTEIYGTINSEYLTATVVFTKDKFVFKGPHGEKTKVSVADLRENFGKDIVIGI